MAKVAVVRVSPETILEDIARAMRLAEYDKVLPKDKDTALKINISWGKFYPACSTTPWQLDGVIRTLLADGYSPDLIHGCHNDTVVVNSKRGEVNNHQRQVVVDKYGLRNVHLYEDEEWIEYQPKAELLVLPQVFPNGVHIPKRMVGENIIHLPTMKTHVFTTMTGAMKNAFGGLLHRHRHWTHGVIHETLVDLLTIQKEIHTGLFAVMDGTWAGDGPGPRCMETHVKNMYLASADQVAIDSIAAKMMGFDPMKIKFIRMAHERGLGVGNPSEIELVGEDISNVNWHFQGSKDTFASRGQKLIYWGPLKPLEKLLLRGPLTPWSYVASIAYHDFYWWAWKGRNRVAEAMRTEWGPLFQSYKRQERTDPASLRPVAAAGR